ncbi:protein SEY1 homolog [Cyclospora cayetanensis]|uniref:Protein SEY1 homolog n=1 Tax=Cyclospora cayetanensis TaxID=88456 RepID=A0A6P6RYS4_9EIME|nr:protein SEY1 homolog [Cyclospora cayetanensis]
MYAGRYKRSHTSRLLLGASLGPCMQHAPAAAGPAATAASSSGAGRKWKRREGADLSLIVVQEDVEASRVGAASWAAAYAGPSSQLPRCLCCCCGMPGRFRCTACFKKRSTNTSNSGGGRMGTAGGAATAQAATSSGGPTGKYLCSAECLSLHRAADCTPRHMLNWLG